MLSEVIGEQGAAWERLVLDGAVLCRDVRL